MSKKKPSPVEYEIHVHDMEIECFTNKKKAQKFAREKIADGCEVVVYSFRTLSTERFVR